MQPNVYDRKKWKKEKEISSSLMVYGCGFYTRRLIETVMNNLPRFAPATLKERFLKTYAEFAYFEEFRARFKKPLFA